MSYTSYRGEVLNALNNVKRDICNEIGNFVVVEAQLRTPVLTGNLRRSVTFEVMDDDKGVYVGVNENAPYGVSVEKGTSTQTAQPFLEPAIMDNIDKIVEIAGQSVSTNMGGS
jgi:HK97 gp10 family phage protein